MTRLKLVASITVLIMFILALWHTLSLHAGGYIKGGLTLIAVVLLAWGLTESIAYLVSWDLDRKRKEKKQ